MGADPLTHHDKTRSPYFEWEGVYPVKYLASWVGEGLIPDRKTDNTRPYGRTEVYLNFLLNMDSVYMRNKYKHALEARAYLTEQTSVCIVRLCSQQQN